MRSRRAEPVSVELLAVRARGGDRTALRDLRAALGRDVTRLAVILVDDPRTGLRLAAAALDEALGPQGPVLGGGDPRTSVTSVLRRLAAPHHDELPDTARSLDERLMLAVSDLCDRQGLSQRRAAALLGTRLGEVERLYMRSQAEAGHEGAAVPRCAGWSLVRRLDDLTPQEADAAFGHLELCRNCAAAHDARVAARRRLKAAVPATGGALAALGGAWGAVTGGAAPVAAPVAGGAAAAVLGALAFIGPHVLGPHAPADPGTLRPAGGTAAAVGPQPGAPTGSATPGGAPAARAPRPPVPTMDPGTQGTNSASGPAPASGGGGSTERARPDLAAPTLSSSLPVDGPPPATTPPPPSTDPLPDVPPTIPLPSPVESVTGPAPLPLPLPVPPLPAPTVSVTPLVTVDGVPDLAGSLGVAP